MFVRPAKRSTVPMIREDKFARPANTSATQAVQEKKFHLTFNVVNYSIYTRR